MKILDCNIPDVKLIKYESFSDERGVFIELFKQNSFKDINLAFIQDNLVFSKKNVLRGLHYQSRFPQGKLISVVKGEIFDVAVDLRKESSSYGSWVGEILSDNNSSQLYIPPGFAHGYTVLSDDAIVIYKCTEYYHPEDQSGIIWNDSDINIDWPNLSPIISEKDGKLPRLKEI